MREVVNVSEMIAIAKNEMNRAKMYSKEGNYELYYDLLKRVDGMISLIAVASIKDNEDFNKEWDKIYDMIRR